MHLLDTRVDTYWVTVVVAGVNLNDPRSAAAGRALAQVAASLADTEGRLPPGTRPFDERIIPDHDRVTYYFTRF
jgi:hypothetical protein